MTIAEQIQKEAEEMFPKEHDILNKLCKMVYIETATKYAELAIEFANWRRDECARSGEFHYKCRSDNYQKKYTDTELYELFLTSKTNNK